MPAKELFKLDFTKGMDVGTEPNASPVVSWLQNYVVERKGGLRRRCGYEPVTNYLGTTAAVYETGTEPTGSTSVEQTTHMTSYKGSLIRAGNSKLYGDGYHFKGMLPDMTGTYKVAAASTNSLVEPYSITATNASGQQIRVVLFKTETTVGDKTYTDLSDFSTQSELLTKTNVCSLQYSLYVNDVLITDRVDITSHSKRTYLGAQLVRSKNHIVVVYADAPLEYLAQDGTGYDEQVAGSEKMLACAQYFQFVALDINNPTLGFGTAQNIPVTYGQSPSSGTTFYVDVRAQRVTTRTNLLVDSSKPIASLTIPYKKIDASLGDYEQSISANDKLVLRYKDATQNLFTSLGYLKVDSVDLSNKTFTANTSLQYSNAKIITTGGLPYYDRDWEIHRVTYTHYYPMFSAAQSETDSSSTDPSGDHFLVSYVVRNPGSSGGYWIESRRVYLQNRALTSIVNLWDGSAKQKATDPTFSTTSAGTTDGITKTYVSALSMACDIGNGIVWLNWAAVKVTLSAGYNSETHSYGIGLNFASSGTTGFTPIARNVFIDLAYSYQSKIIVTSMGSVSYSDNNLSRCAVIWSTRPIDLSYNTIVNGYPLYQYDRPGSPSGSNLSVTVLSSAIVAIPSGTGFGTISSVLTKAIHRDMNARLATHPWLSGGSVYVALYVGKATAYPTDEAASLLVYDMMIGPSRISSNGQSDLRPRPVCNLLPRQVFYQNRIGHGYPLYQIGLPSVESTSNGFRFVSTISTQTADTGISSIIDVLLNITPFRNSAIANNTLFISGGVPCGFDGTSVYELGSIRSPTLWHSVPTPTVSESSINSWYYKAVFEWTDQSGNYYRSSPSDIVQLRMSDPYNANNPFVGYTGGSVILRVLFDHSTIRTLSSNRGYYKNPVKVAIYRSLKNDDTNFYRVTTLPINWDLSNDTNYFTTGLSGFLDAVSMSFTDVYSDTDISSNEILYDNNGAILANQSPPSASFVCSHKGRVWLACTPDDSIWFSKKTEAFAEPGFNEVLTIPAFEGGPVVGIASLDDYLVVLKSNSVWIIQGDGPDSSGANSTLQTPIKIAEGTGCISPGSIAVINDAVYFQAMDGIYRLRRGTNNFELISEPIKDLTQRYLQKYNLKVVSVTFTSVDNAVRFAFYGTYTSGGSTYSANYLMVLNLTYNVWSTYIYNGSGSMRLVSSCEHAGTWYGITSVNSLIRENRNNRYDNGTLKYGFTAALTIEVLRLSEIAGQSRIQRVIVLGRKSGSNYGGMNISISYWNPYRYSFGTRYVTTSYDNVYLEFPVKYQKIDSMSMDLIEQQTYTNSLINGDGESFVITGIALYGSPLRGRAPKGKGISRKTTAG